MSPLYVLVTTNKMKLLVSRYKTLKETQDTYLLYGPNYVIIM